MIIATIILTTFATITTTDYHPFSKAEACWAKDRTAEKNLQLKFTTEWDGGNMAQLKVTAATVYRVLLNNDFIHWGPERTVFGMAKVDTLTFKPKNGRNTLIIEVAGYNVSSFQYSGDESFLCAELEVDGKIIATSPTDFKAVESSRRQTGPVYSRQRGFVSESYELDRKLKPVKLVKTAMPKLLPRAAALPEFSKVNFVKTDNFYSLDAIDSGFIGLKFKCTKPGKIAVEFDEALVNGKLDLNRNGDPLKSWHAMFNRIDWDVKEPGEYTVESIEPYTMKYLEVKSDDNFTEIKPYLRQCCNSGASRVKFECSDEAINRLFKAARNSIAQNSVDIFTDCPSRERVGWLCDTYFTAEAAAWMTGNFTTEQEYLLNFTRTDKFGKNIPKDAIPGFMPSRTGGLMPTYMMWFTLQCAQAANRLSGEAREKFIKAVTPRIKGVFNYLSQFEKDNLLNNLPGWVFIEWSKANDYTKGINYPANMLYAAALDQVGDCLGNKDWQTKASKIRQQILAKSFDGEFFRDQDISQCKTEVAQYYAFFTELATPISHPKLWNCVINKLGPDRELPQGLDKADAFIGWMLRLETLKMHSTFTEMFRSMKAYYGKMADESGTLWEFADGHDSRCHAFGSNIAALTLKAIFGIERINWADHQVKLGKREESIKTATAEIPLTSGQIIKASIIDGQREIKVPTNWKIISTSHE